MSLRTSTIPTRNSRVPFASPVLIHGVQSSHRATSSDVVASAVRAVETPPLGFDPVLVCPSTLGELTEGYRSYGPLGSISYKTSDKRPGFRVRISQGFVLIDAWRLFLDTIDHHVADETPVE